MQQNKNLNTVKIIKSLLFSVIASFIFLLPFYMEAQQQKLSGRVMYDNKKIVDDAMVSVLDASDNSVVVSELTAMDGTYHFNKLKEGNYMISVQVFGQPLKLYGPITIGKQPSQTVIDPFILATPKQTTTSFTINGEKS